MKIRVSMLRIGGDIIYYQQVTAALDELQEKINLSSKELMVIGCSTSEVMGKHIGKASNWKVASEILEGLLNFKEKHKIHLAIQCCEHLNRALIVERGVCSLYNLDQVTVMPHRKAGGALAEHAMESFQDPVVVEELRQQAKAAIDIGSTIIGMHLKPVVVPVRLNNNKVGAASVIAANTRPKLIGGERAKY
ncbi:TIGR01440 family protein [Proteinivorax tanatarense]|uniref:UPF0340 protein PRVXT_002849 n=1 Tax=Proteinivorax tanatarense TaxID=1260629 RepID=A0AAU7VL84_9FIRM